MDIEKAMGNIPPYSTTSGGIYKEEPITIKGGMGEGDPEINADQIMFNGDDSNPEKDLSHETFAFNFNKPRESDFCKTARKPYDFMVCVSLLSLANHVDGFHFSSDGDKEDWQPAIDFYQNVIGKLDENVIHTVELL